MLSRRAFLSALAALPFVGKMIPRQDTSPLWRYPLPPDGWRPASRFMFNYKTGKQWYEGAVATNTTTWYSGSDRPRLTFAEWDQRHQG